MTKQSETGGVYFSLRDYQLTDILQAVGDELRRRTRSAVDGVDVAQQIKGQESAKRAIVVAASCGQSILFVGPPSSGKTMLRALAFSLGVSATFEARLCPCGFSNDPVASCDCTPETIAEHCRTFPATDMFVEVPRPSQRELDTTLRGTTAADMRGQIDGAVSLGNKIDALYGLFRTEAKQLLTAACRELGILADERERIIRRAAGIASLEQAKTIDAAHVGESVNYRIPAFVRRGR